MPRPGLIILTFLFLNGTVYSQTIEDFARMPDSCFYVQLGWIYPEINVADLKWISGFSVYDNCTSFDISFPVREADLKLCKPAGIIQFKMFSGKFDSTIKRELQNLRSGDRIVVENLQVYIGSNLRKSFETDFEWIVR